MTVEILNLAPNTDPTSLVIATFSVVVAGISVHRCRLVNGRRDGLFVSPPARKANGQWASLVGFTPQVEQAIVVAVQAALEGARP